MHVYTVYIYDYDYDYTHVCVGAMYVQFSSQQAGYGRHNIAGWIGKGGGECMHA